METTAKKLTNVGRTGQGGQPISITQAYGSGLVSAGNAVRAIESEITLNGNPIFPRSVHVTMTSRLGYTSVPEVLFEQIDGDISGTLQVFAIGAGGNSYGGLFHASETGDWRVTLDAEVRNIGSVVRSGEVSVQ
jgi:hypothetical protein